MAESSAFAFVITLSSPLPETISVDPFISPCISSFEVRISSQQADVRVVCLQLRRVTLASPLRGASGFTKRAALVFTQRTAFPFPSESFGLRQSSLIEDSAGEKDGYRSLSELVPDIFIFEVLIIPKSGDPVCQCSSQHPRFK